MMMKNVKLLILYASPRIIRTSKNTRWDGLVMWKAIDRKNT